MFQIFDFQYFYCGFTDKENPEFIAFGYDCYTGCLLCLLFDNKSYNPKLDYDRLRLLYWICSLHGTEYIKNSGRQRRYKVQCRYRFMYLFYRICSGNGSYGHIGIDMLGISKVKQKGRTQNIDSDGTLAFDRNSNYNVLSITK